jgi:hypothetical protein
LELVLQECGARELGAMVCASRYFGATGVTERIARKRVEAHPRAEGIAPRPKENYARLLHFADAADLAMRTSATLALGRPPALHFADALFSLRSALCALCSVPFLFQSVYLFTDARSVVRSSDQRFCVFPVPD